MSVELEMILGLAALLVAFSVFIMALKFAARPVMTDRQWRCYMDSLSPYADKTKPHSCPRCAKPNTPPRSP